MLHFIILYSTILFEYYTLILIINTINRCFFLPLGTAWQLKRRFALRLLHTAAEVSSTNGIAHDQQQMLTIVIMRAC